MTTLPDLILPRLPRRAYCTDNPKHGLIIRGREVASTKSHLQLNPSALRHWLLFDIDAPVAALAWERANLPPPNWIAVNPDNSHAHCGYLLEVPVVTSPAGHDKPLRYAAAIENAYRLKLQADPGYAGLICKNPLHERWRNWFLHDHAYSLDELTEWVSLAKPARATEENVGLGRNITLFDTLRSWAYSMVLIYKSANATPDLWFRALLHEAEGINSRFPTLLPYPEVRSLAKSVAKWTWRVFTQHAFSEIQRVRALKRWSEAGSDSAEHTKPWELLGISRRTYYYRKKAGLLVPAGCTDAISDNSGHGGESATTTHPVSV